jgi:hypothetical protein
MGTRKKLTTLDKYIKTRRVIKVRCDVCHAKMAQWNYMPGKEYNYHCDDCVSRGCSCNIIDDDGNEYTDDLGRLVPCCEYNYQENGYTVNKIIRVGSKNPKLVHDYVYGLHKIRLGIHGQRY